VLVTVPAVPNHVQRSVAILVRCCGIRTCLQEGFDCRSICKAGRKHQGGASVAVACVDVEGASTGFSVVNQQGDLPQEAALLGVVVIATVDGTQRAVQHAPASVIDSVDVSSGRQQSFKQAVVVVFRVATRLQQRGAAFPVALLKGQPKLHQAVQHSHVVASEVQHALLLCGGGDGGVCTGSQQQLNNLQAAVLMAGGVECVEPIMAVITVNVIGFTQVGVRADERGQQAARHINFVVADGGNKR